MTTRLLRLAAVLTVAMGASACSTVPDWVDPTTWGSDTPAPQTDNAQTPDLADIPNKPAQTSTPDEQKQVSDSLAADRSQTNYSSEQLRGGGEASAPPPGSESAADRQAASAAMNQANQQSSAPATDATAPAPPSDASQATPPSDQQPAQAAPAPSTQSSNAPPPAPMADNAPLAAPATQVADAGPPPQATSSAPPLGAEPAVPMSSSEGTAVARNYAAPTAVVSPSDAALGFKPSTAPPLDPSVSQFVSAPIIAHYEQTAAVASTEVMTPTAVASTTPSRRSRHSRHGIGGPEQMSGAVVANLDALQASAAA